MKNVLVAGASGTIAGQVIELLAGKADLHLTLFLRSARRLRSQPPNARVVEGDALKVDQLQAAVTGQDIVYVNLAGDQDAWPKTWCAPCAKPAQSGSFSSAPSASMARR